MIKFNITDHLPDLERAEENDARKREQLKAKGYALHTGGESRSETRPAVFNPANPGDSFHE